MPKRIQRKRTKGWRMPEGAVYVGRPTKHGNWLAARKLDKPLIDGDATYTWCVYNLAFNHVASFHTSKDSALRSCVEGFEKSLSEKRRKAAKRELKGKDLVCWCPLDKPCHADVLLRLANEE